jgi:hypothetical protein
MNKPSSDKKTVEEQENLLQSRGFSRAPEGKTPLPGQYAIELETDTATTGANGTQPSYSFLVNSGHCLKKLTGFTISP